MKSNDFLNEDIVTDAHEMHTDHEVQMAREELYHTAEHAIALHKLLRHVSEQQGLEGWVSSKITLANDYLKTVREYLEYELMTAASPDPAVANDTQLPVLPVAEGQNPISQKKERELIKRGILPRGDEVDHYRKQMGRAGKISTRQMRSLEKGKHPGGPNERDYVNRMHSDDPAPMEEQVGTSTPTEKVGSVIKRVLGNQLQWEPGVSKMYKNTRRSRTQRVDDYVMKYIRVQDPALRSHYFSANDGDALAQNLKTELIQAGYPVHNDVLIFKNQVMFQTRIPITTTAEQGVAEASNRPVDMTGKTCEKCKKDQYQERSQHDDMEGKVTCSCGHRVDRWKKKQGVAEGGTLKKIKRGLAGWGAFDKDSPKDVAQRNKAYDTDTLNLLKRGTSEKPTSHSPRDLQARVIDRELKKRGQMEEGKTADKPLRLVMRNGEQIGEIGIDTTYDYDHTVYYAKLYDGSRDSSGHASIKDALSDLLGDGDWDQKLNRPAPHIAVTRAKQGVAEGLNVKQIKKDLDSGMSTDAVIGKHANKRTSNTDEIRKIIQQHAWDKRMKKEGVAEGSDAAKYYIVNHDTNENIDGPFDTREEAETVYDRMIERVESGTMEKNFKIQKKKGVAEGNSGEVRDLLRAIKSTKRERAEWKRRGYSTKELDQDLAGLHRELRRAEIAWRRNDRKDMAEDEQQTVDVDRLLEVLRKANSSINASGAYSPQGLEDLNKIYEVLRHTLMRGNMSDFEQIWSHASATVPDAFDAFADELFSAAGLPEGSTYDEFINALNSDSRASLEENASGGASSAGAVATVNNPASKRAKSKIGSLFGGTYKQPKAKK